MPHVWIISCSQQVNLFFLKKNLYIRLDFPWLLIKNGISWNTGLVVITGSEVVICDDFQAWVGGRGGRDHWGSRDRLKNAHRFEILVSHHHLYSWEIDLSLILQQCFVTFGFTVFKLKSLAPCSLSKTAFLSIYFCLPHPSLNIFCKFIFDNPRISVAGFSFTIYLACSVTLAETTNLIHDVNSKL